MYINLLTPIKNIMQRQTKLSSFFGEKASPKAEKAPKEAERMELEALDSNKRYNINSMAIQLIRDESDILEESKISLNHEDEHKEQYRMNLIHAINDDNSEIDFSQEVCLNNVNDDKDQKEEEGIAEENTINNKKGRCGRKVKSSSKLLSELVRS